MREEKILSIERNRNRRKSNRIHNDAGKEDSIGEGVAPTVERWTPNPTVVGSNPIALTFLHSKKTLKLTF